MIQEASIEVISRRMAVHLLMKEASFMRTVLPHDWFEAQLRAS